MTGRKKWGFNGKNLMALHASEYNALHEYHKNLEQANAKNIYTEFLLKSRTILVYGDIATMNRVMDNVVDSSKSEENHGIGAMAFFRFGTNRNTQG